MPSIASSVTAGDQGSLFGVCQHTGRRTAPSPEHVLALFRDISPASWANQIECRSQTLLRTGFRSAIREGAWEGHPRPTMAQQEAVRQLSGHEPASSAPARLAQCRASASDWGSLGDSTDGSSSIDTVGLTTPKTTAARADHENGTVRWDRSSPKISMCGQSGSRRRLAPGSSRLQADIDAPKQPLDQQGPEHPDSAAHTISNAEDPEPADHHQHVVDGVPLLAVQAAAEEPQQPQHGTGSLAYLGDFGDSQSQSASASGAARREQAYSAAGQ